MNLMTAISTISTRSRTFGRPQFLRTWEGILGLALLLITLTVAVLGPLFASHDPNELGVGMANQPPSGEFLLGTDWLGRDVFSRFLSGGRDVLLLPFVASIIAYGLGGLLGIYSAFRGGVLDAWVSRIFDAMLAFPPMLFALVVVGAAGTSPLTLVTMLALISFPRAGRIVRGFAQAGLGREYLLAALGRSESRLYVVSRELLPNIWKPLLSDFGVRLTYSIIFVSSLSFLGFGVQPPDPDWGRMVADSFATVSISPLASLVPALGIAFAALSVNLIAEGVGRHGESRRGKL